ncbi:hypothetical protein ACE193_20435 [Bernardetia sp. OM2101]|uniref:hypothetical protein n=1 Tax=Bernardetia sp. OM2101 TaxID=3344876 RepID=UPI0035D0876C
MIEIKEWTKYKKLEFKDQKLGDIDLSLLDSIDNNFFDFDTELVFENCEIKLFNAVCICLEKSITFINCRIDELYCHATYFCGGFSMTNTIISKHSTFDCGGHNIAPNEFIIDNCVFNGYCDFFDVYFDGKVKITDNFFNRGTNLEMYLASPYGIKEGMPLILENNKGNLNQVAE